MPKFKITYGGWYQRTTLHLSEIFTFFDKGQGNPKLDQNKLKSLQEKLNLKQTSRENGYLEFVKAVTKEGIEIRYYEDGLYVLELASAEISNAKEKLGEYFEEIFSPALAYLFSLGAPTPKLLANIKIEHPVVISAVSPNPAKFYIDNSQYGEVYSKFSSTDTTVYKTHGYIFIVTKELEKQRELVETQIFFREFKDQLERYLQIHRKIWEEIALIKERRQIKGAELENLRNKLERYQKTISLIASRINQMASYATTRRSIAAKLSVEEQLNSLFQYKFETLTDTQIYIKELWVMTKEYVDSAIKVLVEAKNESTKNSISSLTVITTIGVVAGILSYMTNTGFPKITLFGIFYFLLLLGITWGINLLIRFGYRQLRYKLDISERDESI